MKSEVARIDVLGGINTGEKNSFLVEIYDQNGKGRFLMIDCGVGHPRYGEMSPLPLRPRKNPEVIAITHAHTDHSLLGARYLADYGSRIYMTGPTYETTVFLYDDHLKITEPANALFSREEMGKFYNSDMTIPIWDENWVEEIFPGVKIKFYPNGHIRGSAMVFLTTDRHKVIFGGDISTFDTPTVRGIDLRPLKNLSPDIFFLESTNGTRKLPGRGSEINRLVEIAKRYRLALSPAFGVGKSPDLALELAARRFPVYLDGMGKKILRAYKSKPLYWSKGDVVISEKDFGRVQFIRNRNHREEISYDPRPKVIVTTGGMFNGLAEGYLRKWLPKPDAVVFKTGYVADGTPGARLLTSLETGMPFEIKPGVSIKVEACVENICLSGHNDGRQNLSLVKALNPRKIYINHGELNCREGLARMLNNKGFDAKPLMEEGQVILPQNISFAGKMKRKIFH